MNAEVNYGNRKAVLASNYTLKQMIRGRHVGIKCDLKGNIARVDSKNKSFLINKKAIKAYAVTDCKSCVFQEFNKPMCSQKIHNERVMETALLWFRIVRISN